MQFLYMSPHHTSLESGGIKSCTRLVHKEANLHHVSRFTRSNPNSKKKKKKGVSKRVSSRGKPLTIYALVIIVHNRAHSKNITCKQEVSYRIQPPVQLLIQVQLINSLDTQQIQRTAHINAQKKPKSAPTHQKREGEQNGVYCPARGTLREREKENDIY